jgi:hypothetical protein
LIFTLQCITNDDEMIFKNWKLSSIIWMKHWMSLHATWIEFKLNWILIEFKFNWIWIQFNYIQIHWIEIQFNWREMGCECRKGKVDGSLLCFKKNYKWPWIVITSNFYFDHWQGALEKIFKCQIKKIIWKETKRTSSYMYEIETWEEKDTTKDVIPFYWKQRKTYFGRMKYYGTPYLPTLNQFRCYHHH